MTHDYERLALQMEAEGSVLLHHPETPLSDDDWRELDSLTSPASIPHEKVLIGDASEDNCVWVGRLMTDVEAPRIVNEEVSRRVLAIIGSPSMMRLYRAVTGRAELTIRRCQVNLYEPGSFVGLHLDRDSNPDYISPVVMQFSGDYDGGDYVVHHQERGPMSYRMGRYSLLISRCDIPHEVTRVTRGQRKALVFFLAPHAGRNRRWDAQQAAAAAT